VVEVVVERGIEVAEGVRGNDLMREALTHEVELAGRLPSGWISLNRILSNCTMIAHGYLATLNRILMLSISTLQSDRSPTEFVPSPINTPLAPIINYPSLL
jgi:hypothetical protein